MRQALVLLPFLALATLITTSLVGIAHAQAPSQAATTGSDKYLGMALAVGLACIGAGLAVAQTGVAAMATITEKTELFGRTIIYVGMAEGIAIYGLLIAFLIWIT